MYITGRNPAGMIRTEDITGIDNKENKSGTRKKVSFLSAEDKIFKVDIFCLNLPCFIDICLGIRYHSYTSSRFVQISER